MEKHIDESSVSSKISSVDSDFCKSPSKFFRNCCSTPSKCRFADPIAGSIHVPDPGDFCREFNVEL